MLPGSKMNAGIARVGDVFQGQSAAPPPSHRVLSTLGDEERRATRLPVKEVVRKDGEPSGN